MTSTPTKRKHATNACQSCRDSKIRCDGEHPTCGNCSRKGKECVYMVKDDKRRVPLRTAVDILSQRVTVLTRVLMENGIAPPSMDPEQESALIDICDTLKIPFTVDRPLSQPMSSQEPTDLIPDSSTQVPVEQEPSIESFAQTWPGTEEPLQVHDEYPQDLPGSANDGQDVLSTSDGQLTDGSLADWPWHMFEPTAFLSVDQINPEQFGGVLSGNQQHVDAITATRPAILPVNDNLGNGSSDEEPDSDLVQQVSSRFGALRIASDGQLRYYGAATNYHLLEAFRHDDNEADIFTTKQEALDRLEQAGLAQEVPQDLEDHLIDLYFKWHNPSHLTLDRAIFSLARAGTTQPALNNSYFSDVLINAVCAIGAAYETRYHPSFVTYPRSLAEYFSSRARILLEGDLESPTTATVQALCLLSSHEAAKGRDARTWLYGGMAMRLCFDLGLHIDCTPYVQAGILTSADLRVRQSTFWSCVVVNHLSSFQLGRPFRIDSEEITVRSPLVSTDGTTLEVSSELEEPVMYAQRSNSTNTSEPGTTVLKEWVYLCETLVPVVRKLYGSSTTPVVALQEVSMTTVQQMEHWHRTLSAPLQIKTDNKTPPEVLFLHMAYHHFQILIHRPWTSRRSQPWNRQGPGFRHARHICSTSASTISSLLIQYEKDYSLRFMHNYSVNIIFSAALISLFNAIACQGRRGNETLASQATANLSIFFRALDDLSRSFDSAKRAREHLATIQRNWYSSGSSQMPSSKRSLHANHTARSQKRSRPTTSFPAQN